MTTPSKNKRIKLDTTPAEEPEDHSFQQLKRKSARSKVQKDEDEGEEEIKDILSLNNYCLYAILERLSSNDVIALSQTCARLHELCVDHYQRRYKEDIFRKYIRSKTLDGAYASKTSLQEFDAFYKCHPIKKLQFQNWSNSIRKSYGPCLTDTLKDIESVRFSNVRVLADLNECILQFAPKMKELTLHKVFNEPDDKSINWMEQKYSKLERFAWHLDRELPMVKMKEFLLVNANITCFSLLSKSHNTIKQVINERLRVDELFFDGITNYNLPQALDDLLILCEHQFCKRLHLKFNNSVRPTLDVHLSKLVLLKPYIEGLYFENHVIKNKLAKTLITFDNLKTLQCNFGSHAKLLADIPNLETIYVFWGLNRTNFKQYEPAMKIYAKKSQNLKRIYFRNNTIPFAEFQFEQLNSERRQLAGAPKMKIFFKTDETNTYTGRLNAIKCDYDLVKIACVEPEYVESPLVTEYLTTKKLTPARYRYRRYRW